MSLPSPVHPQRPLVDSSARLNGLDWLRAGAAILVVALHAGIAYLIAPMPGLAWSTQDPGGSPAVDALAWWINGFIMPLFFVQSGFLASGLMRNKGPRGFLSHRTRRVLGPFVLGCVLILPLDLYAWLLGWAADGKIPLRKLKSLKIDAPLSDKLWGVSHLWFLQYLWVFCVAAWGCCVLVEWQSGRVAKWQSTVDLKRTSGPRTQIIVTGLMGVSALALWWEPQILIGFRHSWWPLPANLMFYAPWFALGWMVNSFRETRAIDFHSNILPMTSSRSCENVPFGGLCAGRIVAAFCLFAILLPLIHRHVSGSTGGTERAVLIGLFTLHAWLMVTGLFGSSLRWLQRRPPLPVKYVAEASFWIYLFHHPVVGLAQVSLRNAPLPVEAKFLATLFLGLLLPLMTYEALVRRTWIGVILHGHRDMPQSLNADESPQLLTWRTRRAA